MASFILQPEKLVFLFGPKGLSTPDVPGSALLTFFAQAKVYRAADHYQLPNLTKQTKYKYRIH